MARKSKALKSTGQSKNAPEVKQLRIKPKVETGPDTPQYYVNHIEVNAGPYEFALSLGRIPARLSDEQMAVAVSTSVISVPADLQVLVPARLISGFIRALTAQKLVYEKIHGIVLPEITEDVDTNE